MGAVMGCVDTYDWDNGYSDCRKQTNDPAFCSAVGAPTGGWTCAEYAAKFWCLDNQCLGPEKTGGVYACGAKLNYPERNCCVCGGGSQQLQQLQQQEEQEQAQEQQHEQQLEKQQYETTAILSAAFENGANSTQVGRSAVSEEAVMGCVDTYDWDNGYSDCRKQSDDPAFCSAVGAPTGGWTCAQYAAEFWCLDNQCLGPEKTGGVYACGAKLNYPERNCCVCGGGSQQLQQLQQQEEQEQEQQHHCKPIGSSCDRDAECCPDGAGGPPTCADMGYGKECISPWLHDFESKLGVWSSEFFVACREFENVQIAPLQ